MRDAVGFAVLYRWRVRAGMGPSFVAAWSRLTNALRQKGSLGSRLHRGPDGIWYAYAQWPTEDARRCAFASPSGLSEAMHAMNEAISLTLPEIRLSPVADYLVLPAESGAGADRA